MEELCALAADFERQARGLAADLLQRAKLFKSPDAIVWASAAALAIELAEGYANDDRDLVRAFAWREALKTISEFTP